MNAVVLPALDFSGHNDGGDAFPEVVEILHGNVTANEQEPINPPADQCSNRFGLRALLPLAVHEQGGIPCAGKASDHSLRECIIKGTSDVLGQDAKGHGPATSQTPRYQIGFKPEGLHRFQHGSPFILINP